MAPDTAHRVPSGLLTNEWADVPLAHIVVWKTIVVAFWTLVLGWPGRPRTIVGAVMLAAWVLLVGALYAWATRRFGNPVFHNPLARRLAVRTDFNAPGARVAYMLSVVLAMLPIMAILVLALHYGTSWLGREVPAIPAFLHHHFR